MYEEEEEVDTGEMVKIKGEEEEEGDVDDGWFMDTDGAEQQTGDMVSGSWKEIFDEGGTSTRAEFDDDDNGVDDDDAGVVGDNGWVVGGDDGLVVDDGGVKVDEGDVFAASMIGGFLSNLRSASFASLGSPKLLMSVCLLVTVDTFLTLFNSFTCLYAVLLVFSVVLI